MRKTLIALLFICSALYAEGFYSAGSFSYDYTNTESYAMDGNLFQSDVVVGYEFKGLYIESDTVAQMIKSPITSGFRPYRTEYYMRTGYRFNMIYFEYEHLCIHGVDLRNPQGGHNRFTIGFDTRYEKIRNP
jgi:hypothetical protein